MKKLTDILKEAGIRKGRIQTMKDNPPFKTPNQIKEKKDDKIHKFTQRNNHTEARRLLSSWMGNDKLMSFYEAMETLNKVFNGFPSELSKLNQKMEKELYKQLKRSFANADIIKDAL